MGNYFQAPNPIYRKCQCGAKSTRKIEVKYTLNSNEETSSISLTDILGEGITRLWKLTKYKHLTQSCSVNLQDIVVWAYPCTECYEKINIEKIEVPEDVTSWTLSTEKQLDGFIEPTKF